MALALTLAGCAPPRADPDGRSELSRFAADTLVAGKVLENNTACTVDADCFLRIEFADTAIVALYGTGERPAPPCPLSGAVSDAAFEVGRGEIIEVEVHLCEEEGYYVRQLGRRSGPRARD